MESFFSEQTPYETTEGFVVVCQQDSGGNSGSFHGFVPKSGAVPGEMGGFGPGTEGRGARTLLIGWRGSGYGAAPASDNCNRSSRT